MKIEEIEKMLRAFYDGETTEKEERCLKLFFETEKVPEYLQIDKRIFQSLSLRKEGEVPRKLEEKLIRMIDAEDRRGKWAFQEKRFQKIARWAGGLAAGLLICIFAGYGWKMTESEKGVLRDTFTDPKEAFAAMQAVLTEVSANLNDGLDQLAETRKELTLINDEIRKEIE